MRNLRRTISYVSPIIVCASTSASAALLWCANPAKAIMTIRIYDDGPNLTVETSGSLSALGSLLGYGSCLNGVLNSSAREICTGFDIPNSPVFGISGPANFGGTAALVGADSVSGPSFVFTPRLDAYFIDPSYSPGQPFLSTATFNNTSLAAQGFTVPGLIGTWTINSTSESIQLFVVPAVPGPLPLFGAAAAFGWSRRMRRRITIPVVTPPLA